MEQDFKEHLSKLDYSEKKEGDYVHIIGIATILYMHDYNTKQQLVKNHDLDTLLDLKELKNNLAIVAKCNVNFTYNCGHCDALHNSDTVIYYPHNKKKYYVNSRELKIIE